MLNDDQYQHFQTFGFVILGQFLNAEETETLSTEFEKGLDLAYEHQPFDGTKRHWTRMMGPESPLFARLLEDERFWSVTAQLYGDDAFAVSSDASRYVGDTQWHPDHDVDPTKDCYGMKFAIYLDPIDAETGALRLVPGSHKNSLHKNLRAYMKGRELEQIPDFVCASQPGDTIAFDMRCWHASFGGSAGRRMGTLCYYKNPDTPEQEQTARERAEKNRKYAAQQEFAPVQYDPDWLANPEQSPLRQRWINRLQELGFLDAAA